jgi:hypothetical protein
MLKSVIEDDGVHTEALYSEHASGITILPHDHGQSSQVLRQKDRLIASDLRRHEASLPIRDHCNAWLGSSTVTTTQHADSYAFLLQEAGDHLDDRCFPSTS